MLDRVAASFAQRQQVIFQLVLARDGRPYCEGLARILDETAWDGETFTRVLRLRILRHLDDCRICDNCGTCNVQTRIRE